MTEELLEVVEDGVATITMNRPDALNAVTRDMLGDMHEKVERLAADSAVGAIVLIGAGRAFCAGGDVKAMAAGRDREMSVEERMHNLRSRMEVSRALHEVPVPTIAAIRGPAAGAGLSLALACDLRVASETARLITAFRNVALSGDFGGSWFLTKLVGPAKARELYFTADRIEAEEALSLGLVNKVVPDDELDSAAMELAKRLADGPQVALSYMKKNLNAALTQPLAQVLDMEAVGHSRCSWTDDHKEAAAAFVEKRQPVFQGK